MWYIAFHGAKPTDKHTVDHVAKYDGDWFKERGDNRASNLRWATKKEQSENRTRPSTSSLQKPVFARLGAIHSESKLLESRSIMLVLAIVATVGAIEVQTAQIRGCGFMIGADFACRESEGKDVDVCQIKHLAPSALCSRVSGCRVAVVGEHGWATLKSEMNFSLLSQPARSICSRLASRFLETVTLSRTASNLCDTVAAMQWRRLRCSESALASPATAHAVDRRPLTLGALQSARDDWNDYYCAPGVQMIDPRPVILSSSPNCMRPSPVDNPTACAFPRKQALAHCKQLSACHILHCERTSDYCQVLRGRFSTTQTQSSFGDVDLIVRHSFVARNDTDALVSTQVCMDRHYTSTAGFLVAPSLYYGASPRTLVCRDSICTSVAPDPTEIDAFAQRLRELLITTAQRFSMRSTADEPVNVVRNPAPLLLFSPATSKTIIAAPGSSTEAEVYRTELIPDRQAELRAYRTRYRNDKWLHDVVEVYDRFFSASTSFGQQQRTGFYIETGAVQGTQYDSNSLFFERFLGWQGLLVEANPYSFAKLMVRRPAAFRIETALCEKAGSLQFNLPDSQRTADGCCGRANGRGKYTLRCTPLGAILNLMSVRHVDFFSLDVEGAEMSVLQGFNWAQTTLSVLLIEVYPRFERSYATFLQGRGLTRFHAFSSPTGLNQVWYNASLITPAIQIPH